MDDIKSAFGTELVDIVSPEPNNFAVWQPFIGEETLYILANQKKVADAEKEHIKNQALSILSKCICPNLSDAGGNTTGLVIGYVQSGKTLSFTAVATLACDNNYPMVIVITGISDPLFKQSTGRLRKDLNLSDRPDRKWQHFANPSPKDDISQTINAVLDDWKDPKVPASNRQTILITVMKNHRHLNNLSQILSRLNLVQTSVLVIDDEADQAGLNTLAKKGGESPTYKKLLQLRKNLPLHTFLQYTATPQAPLLINIIDALSPDFAEVLVPGQAYVGGKEFFLEYPSLINIIPEREIPTEDNGLDEPPASLLYAMRVFLLGVAAGMCNKQDQIKANNRSMLVHPSQKTDKHGLYYRWVTQIRDVWKKIFELDEKDPDYQDLLQTFNAPYQDLKSTIDDLPAFEELTNLLPRSIRSVIIKEINASKGKTPEIDWKMSYSHILVGGQAMDRGFTVEGLTVTYMPRGAGVGNADTVQQRARFFGYKRSYLGYCRVFLENIVRDVYRLYVEHEEDIRKQILELNSKGIALSQWRRAFFITNQLKPTRDNVLSLDYMRGTFSHEWFDPKSPHDSIEAVQTNREVIADFLSTLPKPTCDHGHPQRTAPQKHLIYTKVRLEYLYRELLIKIKWTYGNDSQKFTGLLLQIRNYLEKDPDRFCTVYEMGRGEDPNWQRRRTLNAKDEIPNLYQGENPLHSGEIYPGDRLIRNEKEVTIQIHYLQLDKKDEAGQKELVADNVPNVAIWVPSDLAASWYVQEEVKVFKKKE